MDEDNFEGQRRQNSAVGKKSIPDVVRQPPDSFFLFID
jgi:hypothetical protein